MVCGTLLSGSAAAALPPEHEANRLLLLIEQQISDAQWEKASENLERMGALQIKLPVVYEFYRGKVYLQQGLPEKAQHALEDYVVQAGVEGTYYKQALQLISKAEAAVSVTPAVAEITSPHTDAQALKSNDDYVASLQKLFLTNDPKQALLLRINGILLAHAYQGTRIRHKERSTGAEYKLSIDGRDFLIQEKIFHTKGAPEIKLQRLRLDGVDPYVRYGCDYERYMCWVYHPVHQYDRWLLVDSAEAETKELVEAITRLIRLVQGS